MTTQEAADLEGTVWLRREVLANGQTDRQIRHLLRTGEWHRVRHGAYCSGELWRSLSTADRHRLLCRAVLRTAHPSTVLSHVSAAVEHGAPVWGVALDHVHVSRTDGRSGRREAGVVHHRGVLPVKDVTFRHGVPVTVPARAAVEVCTLASVESALVTVNGLLNAGAATLEEVRAYVHDTQHWPASLNTRLVADLADPRLESALESRLWWLFWSSHLPRPVPQLPVVDDRGVEVARLDFAWPDLGVFLEADGRAKYAVHRRQNETLEQFLMREKAREELVCLLTGWVCIRVGWADLGSPQVLARRIARVLASRRLPV